MAFDVAPAVSHLHIDACVPTCVASITDRVIGGLVAGDFAVASTS
jgi:hypothetical protein